MSGKGDFDFGNLSPIGGIEHGVSEVFPTTGPGVLGAHFEHKKDAAPAGSVVVQKQQQQQQQAGVASTEAPAAAVKSEPPHLFGGDFNFNDHTPILG
jgi:hypothetical protein